MMVAAGTVCSAERILGMDGCCWRVFQSPQDVVVQGNTKIIRRGGRLLSNHILSFSDNEPN